MSMNGTFLFGGGLMSRGTLVHRNHAGIRKDGEGIKTLVVDGVDIITKADRVYIKHYDSDKRPAYVDDCIKIFCHLSKRYYDALPLEVPIEFDPQSHIPLLYVVEVIKKKKVHYYKGTFHKNGLPVLTENLDYALLDWNVFGVNTTCCALAECFRQNGYTVGDEWCDISISFVKVSDILRSKGM